MSEPQTTPSSAPPRFDSYVPASDWESAKKRAQQMRDCDPFPTVPPALLSSEHIQDYVKQTAMLHPFHPDSGRLKPASYEVFPGRKIIYWDEKGEKHVEDIIPDRKYTLKANSITFMQIESRIQLPNYIAARFNLRIKHVHRGLLLGTGPLIDPGFFGNLLIPVHNLTSDDYVISGNEGLIWIEFTKTSRNYEYVPVNDSRFKSIEPYKTDREPEYYFEKSNRNNPIRSSIPGFITEARSKAESAAQDAKRATSASRLYAGIGTAAVIASVVGLAAFFATEDSNLMTALGVAGEAKLAATEAQGKLQTVEANMTALAPLTQSEPETQKRLNDSIRRIDTLEADVKRLSAAIAAQQTPAAR